MPYDYQKDGAAIYTESFATIRAEADLGHFNADEEPIAAATEDDEVTTPEDEEPA